ncbi:TonB-dependent receptor [Cyclobacterium jeungdonense]|uniref:TonB-dependent receptor n=1 Tax=Cyclobacterium jeungdonense TaxID=708087 RepID=A0ABT8CCV6_9BACT|nr:TonB-dependent receptor [Cyclobacterium jeungdonense]MDN3690341.1 TonB-dependent receptor [Cyclobacterium jeungdonense]
MRIILLSSFFLVYLSLFSVAQERSFFAIEGTVRSESGEGLPATIIVHELGKGTAADLEGNFRIDGLNPGNYHLHVTHLGYKALTKTIRITTEDLQLDLRLEESAITLQSLTIEANPFKNGPVEQSQSIEVVDREFMEKNNSGTFANALEKLPGISTINTGVGISKPVIRGMSFNRIMVNDRGIKQEGQQWGADHGLEIDPFDVDRVEVVKGPASLIYGSDGMSGVINISPAPFPREGNIQGHLINSYRTNNAMRSHSAMVEGNKNDFVFKGRVTLQDFQDYRVPADRFVYAGFELPVYDNRLKNTAGKERHFSLMTGWRKNWGKSTLTVSRFQQKAGIFTGAVGIPNSYNLRHNGDYGDIEFPRQDNTHLKVISNTTIQLKENWLELDLGYQRNERMEQSLPHIHGVGPTPEGNLALALYLNTFTANARLNYHINPKHQSIIGFQSSLMDNRFGGFEFLLPAFRSLNAGLFYFHEYRWTNNLIVNAGLRLDGARHVIQSHEQPVYDQSLNPTGETVQRNPDIDRDFFNISGATGFSWILNEHNNFKLNLGSSFRIPTPIELATNGIHHGNFRHEIGDADLKSERSYQADLNFTHSLDKLLFGISPFIAYYQDYIYLAPTGRFSTLSGASTLWEYRQNNALFAGAELKFQWAPIQGIQFSLAGEYIYNQNLDTRLPLPLTPPASVLSSIEYSLPKTLWFIANSYFYLEYRQVAAQNRVDRNERTTGGYGLLQAGLGWEIPLGSKAWKIQISGQNLLDTYYFNHLSRYRLLNLPEQGRNINFNLKIPFQLKSN